MKVVLRLRILFSATILCIVTVGVMRADKNWIVNSTPGTDFESGANWQEGSPPANDTTTDIAIFASKTGTSQNPALTTSRSVKGLSFTGSLSGGWILSGPYTLSLGSAGIDSSANWDWVVNQVTVSSLVLTEDSTWTIDSASKGHRLDVYSVITGTGKLTKDGNSQLRLSAGASTFSGGFVLNAGRLGLNADTTGGGGAIPPTSGPIGTGTLTINGGAIGAVTNARTISNPLVLNGNFQVPGYGYYDLTLSGNATLTRDITITLSDADVSSYRHLYLTGDITDGTNAYSISVVSGHAVGGTEYLHLYGTNSFDGGVIITNGTGERVDVYVNNNSSLGTGPLTFSSSPGGNGLVAVATGLVFTNQLRLNATGYLVVGSGGGVFTLNGDVLVAGNRALVTDGYYSGAGAIQLGGAIVAAGPGSGTLVYAIDTGESNWLRLTGSGKTHTAGLTVGGGRSENYAPYLMLAGNNNTFFGPITVNLGTLVLSGTNNTFNGPVTVYTGTFIAGGTNNAFNAGVTVNGGGLVVSNSIGSAIVLLRPAAGAYLPYLAVYYNGLPSLHSASTDGIIAINTSAFDAVTNFSTLGDGTLWLGSSGNGTFTGSALAAWSNNTYRLGGGGGTLTLDRPSSSEGVLTGSAGLEIGKNGGGANFAGSVVLADANTFTGPITVNRGSRLVGYAQQSGGGSPFGSNTGAVTLNGGTLGLSNGGINTARQPVEKDVLTVSGQSAVELTGGTSSVVELNVSSISRSNRGMLRVYRSNGKLTIDSPPAGNPNGILPCWLMTGSATDYTFAFTKYDAANGVIQSPEVAWASAGENDVAVTSGSTVQDTDKTVYAMRLDYGHNLSGAGTITVQGGGVAGPFGGSIANTLAFGSTEGYLINNASTVQGINGLITGSAGLTKVGAGTTSLSATSRPGLTGPITVLAGILQVSCSASVTWSQALGANDSDPVVLDGGTLFANPDASGRIFTRPIQVGPNGGTFFYYGYGMNTYLDSAISGTGLLTLYTDQGGNTTLTLRGNNTHSGGTYIPGYWQGGRPSIVSVQSTSSLGTGDVTVGSGAADVTLILNGHTNIASTARLAILGVYGKVQMNEPGQTYEIAELNGIGTVTLGPGSGTGTTTLKLSGSSISRFAGAINDSSTANGRIGALTKAGTGIVTLNGTCGFTGPVSVEDGSLIVNGSISDSANAVTVAAGATLGGCGTINRPVTISDGGTLSPGDSLLTGSVGVGTLTVSNLTLSAGCTNLFEIGMATNCDKVVVNGNLVLDGVLSVSAAEGFAGGTYEIFSYTGTLTDNKLEVRHNLSPPWQVKVQIDTVQKKIFLIVGRTAGTVFIIE